MNFFTNLMMCKDIDFTGKTGNFQSVFGVGHISHQVQDISGSWEA